jgi:hypothetical protein
MDEREYDSARASAAPRARRQTWTAPQNDLAVSLVSHDEGGEHGAGGTHTAGGHHHHTEHEREVRLRPSGSTTLLPALSLPSPCLLRKWARIHRNAPPLPRRVN